MPGENYILVIGIDEYDHPIYHRLNNPVSDVTRFSRILIEKYGYQYFQEPILNEKATRDGILSALDELSSGVSLNDTLIIYFAGHGAISHTGNIGSWVPFSGTEKLHNQVSNSAVLDEIQKITAKHILLISDACYSGTFLINERSGGRILTHDELEAEDSRWVFVSSIALGPVKEGVIGQGSNFNQNMCEFLEKNILASISATELFDAVSRKTYSQILQQPGASIIPMQANLGGQLIFRIRNFGIPESDAPDVPKMAFALPDIHAPKYHLSRSLTYYDHQKTVINWFNQRETGRTKLIELMLKNDRMVILGGAGSGKSIELWKTAESMQLSDSISVPIFKRFNTYTDENMEDYLPTGWQNADPSSIIIFLDGLDEVPAQYFAIALRKLNAFSDRFPQVRIVISCRTNFYDLPSGNFGGTLNGFVVYTLNDISIDEIEDYATDQLKLDGADFVSKIRALSLVDLVQKPFFLNILLEQYSGLIDFKPKRSEIMHQAIALYHKNNKAHFLTTGISISEHEVFSYLEKIGYVMELMGKNYISDEDLRSIFESKEEYALCKYLPSFQFDAEKKWWMFEHNNIQEYMASRVLAMQPIEKLKEIIGLSLGGEIRIKPTWVNTLSFLFDMELREDTQKLLDWITDNDKEIIIKFDPDRLNEQKRKAVFYQIFEFYSSREIWLYSNKFTQSELAGFAYYSEIFSFLLDQVGAITNSRIVKVNALNVLRYFDVSDFPNEKERTLAVLFSAIKDPPFNAHDVYSVLGTIASLKLVTATVIDDCMAILGDRKNQYIRSGMYRLIDEAGLYNQYIDYLLEGLDISSYGYKHADRESVNLMDESTMLKSLISSVDSPEALKKLLDVVTLNGRRSINFSAEHHENLGKILNSSFDAYERDNSILPSIINVFVKEVSEHRKPWINDFLSFFDKYELQARIFFEILNTQTIPEYRKFESISILINEDILKRLFRSFEAGQVSEAQLQEIYRNYSWRGTAYENYEPTLKKFEELLIQDTRIAIIPPKLKNQSEIFQQKVQESFDLLFDVPQFIQEVNRVFDLLDLESVAFNDLYPSNIAKYEELEASIKDSAVAMIREFTRDERLVSRDEINQWIVDDPGFLHFRIESIHQRLSGHPNILVSDTQLNFIEQWCIDHGSPKRFLFDFMLRFGFQLPEQKVIDLTRHFNSSEDASVEECGSLDKLERFISKRILKAEVAKNVADGDIAPLVWTANAGYALRNNMTTSFDEILSRLQQSQEIEYRFSDLLKLWYKKTDNNIKLRTFFENALSSDLKAQAIKLLKDSADENPYLISVMTATMNSEANGIDLRLQAASDLMELGEVMGFDFISHHILAEQSPEFDYRHFMKYAKNIDDIIMIPKLLDMLVLGRKEAFKKDVFNDLESQVLETLMSLAQISTANFLAVKKSFDDFINEHQKDIENVNFLHFSLARMEEQFSVKSSQVYTAKTALAQYESL
jgi:hypothetical protein